MQLDSNMINKVLHIIDSKNLISSIYFGWFWKNINWNNNSLILSMIDNCWIFDESRINKNCKTMKVYGESFNKIKIMISRIVRQYMVMKDIDKLIEELFLYMQNIPYINRRIYNDFEDSLDNLIVLEKLKFYE